eukprot:TRINITY_DN2968_c0_g1_i1.p1 TRINITY_DN2968_c0_g1~~TRINITY_DN2968_c0_g1_i1.p1  ORF type:complete len:927 (+),score=213.74 TRINITY_DN2968_c0_g1_i1:1256-4036(+)
MYGANITTVPTVVTNWNTAVDYLPDPRYVGNVTVTVQLSDGLQTTSATILITVAASEEPFQSVIVPYTLGVVEDQGVVNISLQLRTAGSSPAIYVTELPKSGALYESEAAAEEGRGGNRSSSVVLEPRFFIRRQWASAVVNYSSYWVENGLYEPSAALGAPECWPDYGDCTVAWCPLNANSYEFLDLVFPEPVYALAVEVYEVYGVGNLVGISAKTYDTQEWQLLWEGDQDETAAAKKEAIVSSPTLFLRQMPQRSNEVLLRFAPGGVEVWPEVDAVLLIGATTIDASPLSGDTVYYVQDPDSDAYFSGSMDYVGFMMDDDQYYMRYRNLDVGQVEISLNITEVNDPPKVRNATVQLLNDSAAVITYAAADYDGPLPLTYAIVRRPALGELQVMNDSNTLVVLYRPYHCEDFTDFFTYTASDGADTSSCAYVMLDVRCSSGQSTSLRKILLASLLPACALLCLFICVTVPLMVAFKIHTARLRAKIAQLEELHGGKADLLNSPAEFVVQSLQKLKEKTKDNNEVQLLQHVISLIASNKLYQMDFDGSDAVSCVDSQTRSFLRQMLNMHTFEHDKPSLFNISSRVFEGLDAGFFERLTSWDFHAFHVAQELKACQKPPLLEAVGDAIFQHFNLYDALGVQQEVFLAWLRAIGNRYQPNSYHNVAHAADVTQAAFMLFNACRELAVQFTDLETMALFVAALAHDVGHPGVNSGFLLWTLDDVTLEHNGTSVLENMHASTAFKLLLRHDNGKLNFLQHLSRPTFLQFYNMVVELIVATDMARHVPICGEFKARLAAKQLKLQEPADKLLLLKMLLKMADISNAARPWDVCFEWATLIREEFFLQGDKERKLEMPVSQFMDRNAPVPLAKVQTSFLEYVIRPLVFQFQELFESYGQYREGDAVPGGTRARFLLLNVDRNLVCWQQRKDEL